jgi:hypothetical protein
MWHTNEFGKSGISTLKSVIYNFCPRLMAGAEIWGHSQVFIN